MKLRNFCPGQFLLVASWRWKRARGAISGRAIIPTYRKVLAHFAMRRCIIKYFHQRGHFSGGIVWTSARPGNHTSSSQECIMGHLRKLGPVLLLQLPFMPRGLITLIYARANDVTSKLLRVRRLIKWWLHPTPPFMSCDSRPSWRHLTV